MRSAIHIMMFGMLAWAAMPETASAQIMRGSVMQGLHKSDVETIQPMIRDMLDNDEVGATRPWSSQSGNHGEIRLVKGGKLAGMDTGRVRITVVVNERRTRTFTFRYKQDAEGGWRTVG